MNFALLDFVDKNNSDFEYKIYFTPDGHQSFEIDPEKLPIGPNAPHLITIKTRIKNFSDVETLICSVKCLRNMGFRSIELFSPYIISSGFDDVNSFGTTRYFKDVMGPILNSLNFTSVLTLDSNSRVFNNFLQNFEEIKLDNFVNFVVSKIYKDETELPKNNAAIITINNENSEKLYKLFSVLEIETIYSTYKLFNPIDKKTNITELNVYDFDQKDVIIVGDICRSGKEYIALSNLLETKNVRNKYLIINHGIFCDGFTELDLHFNKIFCTNSFSDLEGTFNVSGKKNSTIPIKEINDLVIQFNIF